MRITSTVGSRAARVSLLLLLGAAIPLARAYAGESLLPEDPDDWIPAIESKSTPSVRIENGAQVFECPFPADTERQVWDFKTRLDLNDEHGFDFAYTCENADAIRAITWYVKSGADWFAATLPVANGRQRQWIPFSAFEPVGKPVGWKMVNGFRLSPWSTRRGSGRILLHSLQARQAAVAIVQPDESAPNAAERAYGERLATGFSTLLNQIAMPYTILRDSTLSGAELNSFKLLILPYNPQLAAGEIKALRRFVEQGGKLMVFYNAQPELARLMGIKLGRYMTANRPGRWQGMVFDWAPEWTGPKQIRQTATANIYTAEPASDETRSLAQWSDARDISQPETACFASPQGFWFTHILTTEDAAAKQWMLATMLERVVPGTLLSAAAEKLEQSRVRLGRPFESAIAEWSTASNRPATDDVEKVRTLESSAREALARKDAPAAWKISDELAAALDRWAALRWPPRAAARRGIWDHSGLGLYAGDWTRMAGELAQAGLEDVFVFTPRSASRPAAAAQACKASGLRAHAWHICWNLDGEPADRIRELERSGRLQRAADGKVIHWLCPSQAANRDEELDRLEHLAGTPGIAGVHLDYIRYPDEKHCYCPACRRAFCEAENIKIADWPADVISGPLATRYRVWRAAQITALVKECRARLKTKYPALLLSAAVWPDYPAIINRIGQDWGAWLREGLLDFVCPMNYTENEGEQASWTARQTALPGAEGKIIAGIGVTSSSSNLRPAQSLRQIHEALHAGASGFVLFDLNYTLRAELFPLLAAPETQGAAVVK